MPELSELCGELIQHKPEGFVPQRAVSNSRTTYHIDYDLGVVRRVKLHETLQPVAYYRLVHPDALIPSVGPPTKSRFGWAKGALGVVAALALVLLLYPLYPGAQYHAQKLVVQTFEHTNVLAATPSEVSASNEVIIPKIGVRTRILEAPNLSILDREEGVWHQTGALAQNMVLAGHRFKYLPPNTSTLYNLGQLQVGDSIITDYQGRRTIYAVNNIETVSARQVSELNQDGGPRLTIYTCSDKHETKRIVVHATIVP